MTTSNISTSVPDSSTPIFSADPRIGAIDALDDAKCVIESLQCISLVGDIDEGFSFTQDQLGGFYFISDLVTDKLDKAQKFIFEFKDDAYSEEISTLISEVNSIIHFIQIFLSVHVDRLLNIEPDQLNGLGFVTVDASERLKKAVAMLRMTDVDQDMDVSEVSV